MELVYLYVKDFGILKDASFNFSSKYHFSFDLEQWTLTATETANPLPANFFSNNQSGVVKNISALIGSNGSGKTSVAKVLNVVFSKRQVECLLVFEVNGEVGKQLLVFNSLLPKLKSQEEFERFKKFIEEVDRNQFTENVVTRSIPYWANNDFSYTEIGRLRLGTILCESSEQFPISVEADSVDISFKPFSQLSSDSIYSAEWNTPTFVYNSNFYDCNHKKEIQPYTDEMTTGDNACDLSTSALLWTDSEYLREEEKGKSILDQHRKKDLIRNVDFFKEVQVLEKIRGRSLGFGLPKVQFVVIKTYDVDFRQILSDPIEVVKGAYRIVIERLTEFLLLLEQREEHYSTTPIKDKNGQFPVVDLSQNGKKRSFLLNMWLMFLLNFIRDNRSMYSDDVYGEKALKDFGIAVKDFNAGDLSLDDFRNFTLAVQDDYESQKFVECWDLLASLPAKAFRDSKHCFIPVGGDGENCITMSFLENYFRGVRVSNYLEFDWDPTLSAGEYSQYNIYSRIYDLVNRPGEFSLGGHFILFFDEIETTVHPEVQRKLVQNLITFCETFLSGFTVQLIFASHSPILLSDIPKSTVTFMKKIKSDDTGFDIKRNDGMAYLEVNKKGADAETFGANIHSLYRHSFFLERGAMGAFAEGKINGLIKDIEGFNSNSDLADLESRIGMVGEPVIKKVLEDQLKAKIIAHHDLGRLEEYIAQLQDRVKTLKTFECSEEAK